MLFGNGMPDGLVYRRHRVSQTLDAYVYEARDHRIEIAVERLVR